MFVKIAWGFAMKDIEKNTTFVKFPSVIRVVQPSDASTMDVGVNRGTAIYIVPALFLQFD